MAKQKDRGDIRKEIKEYMKAKYEELQVNEDIEKSVKRTEATNDLILDVVKQLAKELKDVNKQQRIHYNTASDVLVQINRIKENIETQNFSIRETIDLTEDLSEARATMDFLRGIDQKELNKDQLAQYEKDAKAAEEKQNALTELRDLVKDYNRKYAKTKQLTEEHGGIIKKINDYWEDIVTSVSVMTDKIAAGIVITKIADASGVFLKNIANLVKETGLGVQNAAKLGVEMGKAQIGAMFWGVSMQQIKEATIGITSEFGTIADVNSKNIKDAALLMKWYNLSGGEAAKIQRIFTQISTQSNETAGGLVKSVKAASNLAGVLPAEIFRDIAQNAEEIAMWSNNIDPGLINASITARKLGLNLNTSTKIGHQLLDIETSITKELEASVLLGRQINLSRAREYALMGDIEGATKAVVQQLGTVDQFNKLNIIQRQSLAEAIGVSVDDLSRMVNRQDMLNKSTGKFSQVWEWIKIHTGGVQKFFSKDNLIFMGAMARTASALNFNFAGIANKIPGIGKGLTNMVSKLFPARTAAEGMGKTINKTSDGLSKFGGMDPTKMIKGAAAIAILSAALIGFGFAVEKISNNLKGVVPAIVALAALTGAALLLGGVGPAVLTGAAAITVLSIAMMGAALAFQNFGIGMELIKDPLIELTDNVTGEELTSIGLGLGVLGMGMSTLGLSTGPMLLAIPALMIVSKVFGGIADNLSEFTKSGILVRPVIKSILTGINDLLAKKDEVKEFGNILKTSFSGLENINISSDIGNILKTTISDLDNVTATIVPIIDTSVLDESLNKYFVGIKDLLNTSLTVPKKEYEVSPIVNKGTQEYSPVTNNINKETVVNKTEVIKQDNSQIIKRLDTLIALNKKNIKIYLSLKRVDEEHGKYTDENSVY